MRSPRVFGVFLLAVFVRLLQAQEATVFQLEEQWRRGETEEGEFLGLLGIAPLDDGSIIVTDKLSNTLLRIDRTGKIVQRRQKKGVQAGAFRGPGPIAAWRDVVAVADFGTNRIQLLTKNLDPVTQFQAAGSVFSLCFDQEGNLWVGAMARSTEESLFKYDQKGIELLRRRTQMEAQDIFSAIFHLAGKARMRVVYATKNAMELWDLEGKALGTVRISGFPLRGKEEVPPDVLFVTCAAGDQDEVALLAGDVGTSPRQEVFCVNDAGEITGLFILPDRTSAFQFLGSDRVVAIHNRKTVVSSYHLTRRPRGKHTHGSL